MIVTFKWSIFIQSILSSNPQLLYQILHQKFKFEDFDNCILYSKGKWILFFHTILTLLVAIIPYKFKDVSKGKAHLYFQQFFDTFLLYISKNINTQALNPLLNINYGYSMFLLLLKKILRLFGVKEELHQKKNLTRILMFFLMHF